MKWESIARFAFSVLMDIVIQSKKNPEKKKKLKKRLLEAAASAEKFAAAVRALYADEE